ncbi:hypothetical protein P7C70_g8117, partial [Phenoliferia sp. Uapishka_3]
MLLRAVVVNKGGISGQLRPASLACSSSSLLSSAPRVLPPHRTVNVGVREGSSISFRVPIVARAHAPENAACSIFLLQAFVFADPWSSFLSFTLLFQPSHTQALYSLMSDSNTARLGHCKKSASCTANTTGCDGLRDFFKTDPKVCELCSCPFVWHLHAIEAAPRIPPPVANTSLSHSSNSNSHASSSSVPGHHLPIYDSVISRLQSSGTPQVHDEPEAKPSKVPLASASAANTVALERLRSNKGPASAQARATSGTFKSKKTVVVVPTKKSGPKYQTFKFFLMPDLDKILEAEDVTRSLFSRDTFQFLNDNDYLKTVSVNTAHFPYGVALCEAAKSVFPNYVPMDGETVPEFVLLRVSGHTTSGRTPFKGTMSLRVDRFGVARRLVDIVNPADATTLFVKPTCLLETPDVIVIARPPEAYTPWLERFWSKEEEEWVEAEEVEGAGEARAIAPVLQGRPVDHQSTLDQTQLSLCTHPSPALTWTTGAMEYASVQHFVLAAASTHDTSAPRAGSPPDSIIIQDDTCSPAEQFMTDQMCARERTEQGIPQPPYTPFPWALPLYEHLEDQVNSDFELHFDDSDIDSADIGMMMASRELDYFIKCIYMLFPKKTTQGGFTFENKALLAVVGGDHGIKMLARHLIASYEYSAHLGILHSHVKQVLQHLESLVTTYRSFLSDMDWLPGFAGLLALELERARQPDGSYWKEGPDVKEHPLVAVQCALLAEVELQVRRRLEFSDRSKVEHLVERIMDGAAETGYLRFAFKVAAFAKWFFSDGDLAADSPANGEHPGFRDLVFDLCASTQYNLFVHFAVYDVPELQYPGCSPFFMTKDYYEAEKDHKAKGKNKKFVFWGSIDAERVVLRKKGKGKERAPTDTEVEPQACSGESDQGGGVERPQMADTISINGKKRKDSDAGLAVVGRATRARGNGSTA